MALKYADRLAWAKEVFERNFTVLDTQLGLLRHEVKTRCPHQDDEDDCLMEAAAMLLFASEQVDEAIKVLREGV